MMSQLRQVKIHNTICKSCKNFKQEDSFYSNPLFHRQKLLIIQIVTENTKSPHLYILQESFLQLRIIYIILLINQFSSMSNYSYLFKLIIIGDTSVGKSCILLHFLQKKFKFDHDTTIGVEFGSKIINVANQSVKLQIWDTAGQETFKSITRSYYRGSIGVVLVYDITSRESFTNINKWLDETKTYSNDKITSFLVGNKSDLQNKRSVTYDQGFNLAKKNGLLFMECSAKNGQNIEGIFGQISEAIVGKIERGEIDPKNESIGIKLGSMQGQIRKEKNCC